MDNIISSKEIAEKVATNLYSSLDMLMKTHSLDFAVHTKLGGNTRAQEVVKMEQQMIDSFLSAIQKDIDKIKGTAVEFDRMDQEIQSNISAGRSLANWEGMNHGK